MRKIKSALILLVSLAVVGCSTSGPYQPVPVEDIGTRSGSVFSQSDYPVNQPDATGQPDQSPPSVAVPVPAQTATNKPANTAVASLLVSAQSYRQQQDYLKASAALERAIRISPRDGELYYLLAQVRFQQTNYQQAVQLSRKAVSLAAGDKALIARSRALEEKAGTALGR